VIGIFFLSSIAKGEKEGNNEKDGNEAANSLPYFGAGAGGVQNEYHIHMVLISDPDLSCSQ
jgi:hypothetical protein